MYKEYPWTWFYNAQKRIHLPYQIKFFIVIIFIYLIFLFLSYQIGFPWKIEAKINFIIMGTLISYQLIGTYYLFGILKDIHKNLSQFYCDNEDHFYVWQRRRFSKSKWYYVSIIFVVLPFYLINWHPMDIEQILFSAQIKVSWETVTDAYRGILGFISLFLLAMILGRVRELLKRDSNRFNERLLPK